MLPYIQIGYKEAIEAKKQILSSEINILNITKKISSYKKIRKSEIIKKTKLKRAIKHNIAIINSLSREMPEVESSRTAPKKENKLEINKKKSIENELAEIRRKLDSLNA
jgi:hypothetical protein